MPSKAFAPGNIWAADDDAGKETANETFCLAGVIGVTGG
jgi:hypothetical protein